MKKIVKLTFLLSMLVVMIASCGGGNKHQDNQFVGKFTDEFKNKFELKDDYTATIQFVGEDSVIKTTWFDGEDHKRAYATIKFNGDPNYYYLRDGKMYRAMEDMEKGTAAINIKYDD